MHAVSEEPSSCFLLALLLLQQPGGAPTPATSRMQMKSENTATNHQIHDKQNKIIPGTNQ